MVKVNHARNRLQRWWARLRGSFSPATETRIFVQSLLTSLSSARPVFAVVEGPRDVDFLNRISAMLHRHDSTLPDLASLEADGKLVFVPFGGGDVRSWAFRLAGAGAPEVHIYDREMPPETEIREQVARIVNLRPACRAFLTNKRALENYLDSDSVFEATGLRIEFSGQDDVAEVLAQSMHQGREDTVAWYQLPARSRKRRREKLKRVLNTRAVERMTAERLARTDPQGEIRCWLTTIVRLIGIRQ